MIFIGISVGSCANYQNNITSGSCHCNIRNYYIAVLTQIRNCTYYMNILVNISVSIVLYRIAYIIAR